MKTSRFVLVGAGNIGRGLLQILSQKAETLRQRQGWNIIPVAVVDSSGAAIHEEGLDIAQVLKLKQSGQGVAEYPKCGRQGLTALQTLDEAQADLLVELSPTNLQHGEPGLSAIVWALEHGMDVVTANKGPLVLDYARLTRLAAARKKALLFSGAVAGGLPTINIGRRDLVAARILRVEGIFNTTTNYILMRMDEGGLSFDEALAEAQRAGVAEADPTLDIDGWDATNKLIIVANSVLGMPATLATAEPAGDSYRLSVQPTELPLEHPMARLTKWQMGVVYTTDINGIIIAIIEEEGTLATAGAVLRDVVNALVARP
jgi:homoserine dehydrogenase